MSLTSDQWFFVFGTLKPGYTQYEWNQKIHNAYYNLTCHKAYLREYELYTADYPTILPKEGKYVEGYILTSKKWEDLVQTCDNIEGYPDFYTRIQVQVELASDPSQKVTAWAYQMQPNKYEFANLKVIGPSFIGE